MTPIEFYSLPENVIAILSSMDEDKDDYAECKRISEELKDIGWSCDYYLDAEIFDVFPSTFVDNNGDTWTIKERDSRAMSYTWTADFLPENVTIYCTPFFDGEDIIPLEIVRSVNGEDEDEGDQTVVTMTEGSDMLEEMKKLFATVKTKI
jgi:hypothetical protein